MIGFNKSTISFTNKSTNYSKLNVTYVHIFVFFFKIFFLVCTSNLHIPVTNLVYISSNVLFYKQRNREDGKWKRNETNLLRQYVNNIYCYRYY